MAWNTKATLTRLEEILQALPGLQYVQKGAPESIGTNVMGYVAVGSGQVVDKATQLLQREQRFFVGFAYRVKGAEADAEDAIADLLDAFVSVIYADRTLGGTVHSSTLDLLLSTEPRYEVRAGQEFRVFPIVVVTTMYSNP